MKMKALNILLLVSACSVLGAEPFHTVSAERILEEFFRSPNSYSHMPNNAMAGFRYGKLNFRIQIQNSELFVALP